ncbi:hypothetical protein [Moraxella bovis]|uniref:Bro-N domain-containing protein n=1 Tax=Moraxella bovis TaxID=476 RepID=A0ABY6M4G8_MORBO|nr:hypothetical protein [Moraxella bovis]UZA02061.1 hypothetical protein LP092_08625 [Moraxella bovis]UZA18306.1 hypothetical protein LP088_08035 [Moraxella bovis]UZA36500.1 hypothetical protein LP098_05900 [Moraxella bovis]
MQNQIINFTFEAQTIRTATNPQGEVYFCLLDVLPVLGLESRTISKFNFDNKGVAKANVFKAF